MRNLKRLLVLSFVLAGVSHSGLAQEAVTGEWEGVLVYMEVEREFSVVFRKEDEVLTATIEVPEAGLYDAPLKNVSFSSPDVHFELTYGGGEVIFDGQYKGEMISGEYDYEGYQEKFELTRKK